MSDFWVFGYGSLMWNPGFFFDSAILAHVYGYHRSLCIYSVHHRGTNEIPGLIFGLDRGGSCVGTAFHVPEEEADKTYKYLLEREQPTKIYHEKWLKLFWANGEQINALAFVADRKHKQYAGVLSVEEMTRIVQNAHGLAGSNVNYVLNTAKLLREKNINDKRLRKLEIVLQNLKL